MEGDWGSLRERPDGVRILGLALFFFDLVVVYELPKSRVSLNTAMDVVGI